MMNVITKNNIPLVLIAAHSTNYTIGYQGDIPWYIPQDLIRFRQLTKSYPIIMGRKTWDGLHIRPLAHRLNIVVSTTLAIVDSIQTEQNSICIVRNLADALTNACEFINKTTPADPKIFIIGGERLYRETIDQADYLQITEVHTVTPGDAFFPNYDPNDFDLISTQQPTRNSPDSVTYSFKTYKRK